MSQFQIARTSGMPTYVYRILRPAGAPVAELFEVHQSIHDPPLTKHPETGEPVERVLCPPLIGRGRLTEGDLAQAGLTRYHRGDDGTYEKGD